MYERTKVNYKIRCTKQLTISEKVDNCSNLTLAGEKDLEKKTILARLM